MFYRNIKEPVSNFSKSHVGTACLGCHNGYWTIPTISSIQKDIILFQLLEVLADTGMSFPGNCLWLKGALPHPSLCSSFLEQLVLRHWGMHSYEVQQRLASTETTLKPVLSPRPQSPLSNWLKVLLQPQLNLSLPILLPSARHPCPSLEHSPTNDWP